MSVVAMELQCMKTMMIHLVDKSDFILFDHKTCYKSLHRVATNLENLENLEKSGNLKETSESQGICLKNQGICDRIPKVRELCCLKFIFS